MEFSNGISDVTGVVSIPPNLKYFQGLMKYLTKKDKAEFYGLDDEVRDKISKLASYILPIIEDMQSRNNDKQSRIDELEKEINELKKEKEDMKKKRDYEAKRFSDMRCDANKLYKKTEIQKSQIENLTKILKDTEKTLNSHNE